ncbi:hypothetical protein ACWEQ8_41230 [Streptomyces noursei]
MRLPNPLRAAAVAALLFTGTTKSLLSMTQIDSSEDAGTTMAIDRDSRINIAESPGPQHMYAVPPRARFPATCRRRIPPPHPAHRRRPRPVRELLRHLPTLRALVADADIVIPALAHPTPETTGTPPPAAGTCTLPTARS